MKKCWTLFLGSSSDQETGLELMKSISPLQQDFSIEVASAHRQPLLLKEKIKEKQEETELFFAGAGLSAHLPGVLASMTTKPVVGLPFRNMFEGFDAWCSVWQMPFGVPVLSVHPYGESWNSFVNFLRIWKTELTRLNFEKESREHVGEKTINTSPCVSIYDPHQKWEQPFLKKEKERFFRCLDMLQWTWNFYIPNQHYQQNILITLVDPFELMKDSHLILPQGSILVPMFSLQHQQSPKSLIECWPIFKQHAPWVGNQMLTNALLAKWQLSYWNKDQEELVMKIRRGELS